MVRRQHWTRSLATCNAAHLVGERSVAADCRSCNFVVKMLACHSDDTGSVHAETCNGHWWRQKGHSTKSWSHASHKVLNTRLACLMCGECMLFKVVFFLFVAKLPKSCDPNATPDPERWLPLRERSYYRGKRKSKKRDAGLCVTLISELVLT